MHYSSALQFFASFSNNLNEIIIVGGYPIIFLTVILEGLPLIGTIVPGHVAIIVGGFLAHSGIMNVWWVVTVSMVAAILGDAFGFYLGRRYGIGLIDKFKRYFFIRDEHIKKAQNLLLKHTGKAMILGRLSPMTRALMPFLVGIGKTSHVKFWLFNCIGAVIWVGSSVILGYGFSFGFHAAASYFGKAVVGAIILGGLIIWGYRFVNIRFHIFRRYELFALIINVISLTILALMVRDAWSATSLMTNFDLYVNGFMNTNVNATSINIAQFISAVGGVMVPVTIGLILTFIFLVKRRWRSAAITILSVMSAMASFSFLKEFFQRARPDNALVLLTDPSFPSGHATMAAAFFFVCAYLFAPKIQYWVWRESFIVLCAIGATAIGLSRLVLNVHWVSDIVGGWALGLFCATASVILVRYASELVKGRRL
ncbi:MAG TPA: bifunctional DedA family/phosphatase PAP2 family protein [Candidatus Paceibacterota bacterium]|jgi:undecaprenyl-diphosphatase|nr:bifunctional DedA family/phosphatase PAP2 family protein [Candidatus Paceibacterota bacterium]